MDEHGRLVAKREGEGPEELKHFLFDDLDIDLIAVMAAEVVMSDERDGVLELSPAEAMAAIRRFDLTSFDWAPKDRQEFRYFLGRYVPLSVLQSLLNSTDASFDSFMGAWRPDSPWCPIFMRMVGLARHGAVRAYAALLAEEAGLPLEDWCAGSPPSEQARASSAPRHKGIKTVQ